MNESKDDDSRFALGLIFVLIAAVVAGVLGFAVMKSRTNFAQGTSDATSATAAVDAINHEAAVNASANAAATVGAAGVVDINADAANVIVENGVVKFYFATGSKELAAKANEALVDVVAGVQAGKKAIVSGFHDSTGDAAQNAELAKQRAIAVRDALHSLGVSLDQIELKKPENMQGTGSNAQARRVEVRLE